MSRSSSSNRQHTDVSEATVQRPVLDLDQSLINRLLRVVNLAAEPFAEKVGSRFNLSINDWRVLRTIAFEPGLSQQGVSDRCGLDKMTISRVVNRLVDAGRMARSTDPRDGRKARLTLTDQGWAIYDGIVPTALEREAEFFANLSEADRAALSRIVDQILSEAERRT